MNWRRRMALVLALVTAACSPEDTRTEIAVQRFFGECGLLYGRQTDVRAADGECGIMTAMLNRFQAENPGLKVDVNIVAWPGYNQLSAQLAAGDPPDVVVMHQSVIGDYQARGLIEPLDEPLRKVGVDPGEFTPAALRGVTRNGNIYGLPFDSIGPLFHVNTGLFAAAGLMRGGVPVLPNSPGELLAQARQFKKATGKPYFVQSQVNDPATYVRNLYTYLMAQGEPIFTDPRHIRLRTPAARRIVLLFRQLNREGLSTRDQDPSAAAASFMRGEGGVYPIGTWMIGDFDKEARTPGRPLFRSYAAVLYPRLFARDAAFADGHSWVVPARSRTPAQRQAVARFLKFMAANGAEWSRTGHLPATLAMIASPEFKALPHRRNIARLAEIGSPLPEGVQRQSAIQDIVGDELADAIGGTKPVERALSDAERRVNELLSHGT
jgi:multiple sugar transport system substrate-binding protein